MKNTIVSVILAIGLASANSHPTLGSHDTWAPAGPDDFRGPCPMMNTLANHGFLPHDGKNLTSDAVVQGLQNGLGFDPSLGAIMFSQALVANPEPNATYFTLDHLNVHNVLEHDASLSRSDAYFGNNHVFNQSVFDTTKAYWTSETVTPTMLANGKLFRQIESRSSNPNYTFTTRTEAFSLGEVSAPIVAFGDLDMGTVNRTLVEYFFENERFPTKLGWSLRNATVTLESVGRMLSLVGDATNLFTNSTVSSATSESLMRKVKRRDLHAGIWDM
ncbi:Chloroperoxidase [Truncatella angustata]|uniref:Chloroperoxidase n=1 Tax=Truncatella angustata TaxID=152316 RepID=A0A9P8ZW95_9PEZI|nr:Chloroperoxidase [Truncatella angustata]KAH6652742.1 Chloroperoxidase [Truncatella angustata]